MLSSQETGTIQGGEEDAEPSAKGKNITWIQVSEKSCRGSAILARTWEMELIGKHIKAKCRKKGVVGKGMAGA